MRIAIITSRYPSRDNPYNHMFVHMRAVEMVKKGISLTVFVPSSTRSSYEHELVTVRKGEYQEIIEQLIHYDVAYLHLLNIYPFSKRNGWPIYKHILKANHLLSSIFTKSSPRGWGCFLLAPLFDSPRFTVISGLDPESRKTRFLNPHGCRV